jgi:hypothetical protein
MPYLMPDFWEISRSNVAMNFGRERRAAAKLVPFDGLFAVELLEFI